MGGKLIEVKECQGVHIRCKIIIYSDRWLIVLNKYTFVWSIYFGIIYKDFCYTYFVCIIKTDNSKNYYQYF